MDRRLSAVALLFFLAVSQVICDDLTSFKVDQTHMATHKAVSDAADVLISAFGWTQDKVKIAHVDTTDSRFGQTLAYEFDVQVGDEVIPLRLSEEVQEWKYLEELPAGSKDSLGIRTLPASTEEPKLQVLEAILAPFQVAGPVELWIQDAEQLRLAVPNDVEAGVLKKVILADGAVVTVEGAREVSLARPLQLPLPLPGISNDGGLAASLVALANRLRYASQVEEKPLLSLKIVGPTSLVASNIRESESSSNRLKVKRLSPGAIELVSRQHANVELADGSPLPISSGMQDAWLWPLPSLNGSDSRLMNLEKLLISAIGPNAYKKGSFKLLRAKVSAITFARVEFQLEKKLSDEDFPSEVWPEWWTKPAVERLHFEVLAKVEGQKLTPVSVQATQPYRNVDSATWAATHGNISYHKVPKVYLPPSSMTLNPNW
ncbi:hypothetical protein KP509_39G004900 [Ceratopteris richardii]|uniref:Uncharacterized protein n=1 Tax=Ceratopteris richardii TaxID=49495 RepID=A0A8T2PYQ5_CERRI|nr:hypothetical protein KP509_39G004900 [Ceratopteris richardii]